MSIQNRVPQKGDTIATLRTSKGEMKAIIFTAEVGECATNFIELAKGGFYKDVPFHRVIADFVLQCGDFTKGNGTGGHSYKGPGTNIGDVFHPELKHVRGALSWAKTARPNSIGSQFFIVHPAKGARFLDHPEKGGPAEGYSVFGQVFEGLEVIDAVAALPTDSNDRPREDVFLLDVEISHIN